MIINIITFGKKATSWISEGFHEYTKRMPHDLQIELTIISKEKQLLDTIHKNGLVVALDEHGEEWNTQKLANNLQKWRENYRSISLIIGGADGLSKECLQKADIKWSLSKLTMPHQLVKVIVAEQLYRAWTIISKHPYHRQ